MNGPTGQRHETSTKGGPMNRAVIISLILHAVVIASMIVGLPYIKTETELPPMISVELATVADITQSNKPPVKAPEPDEKKEEPPTKVEKPTPKPQDAPKPEEKQPEPEKKPVEVKKETPEVDELAPPKKTPEKKPEKKPEPKKPDPKKEANKKSLDSLLKNLTKEEAKPKSDIGDVTKKLTEASPSPETPNLGEALTISDIDALRQQLAGCWNVFAGAAEAEDLSVDVRVIVNADRTVKEASVMDQSRYNNDDRFRAAAESALRAVRDPRCSPLRLPREKYNLWHDMVINFDPKEML